MDWSDDQTLAQAIAEVHPCLNGWPSQSLFDYDYQLVSLNDTEFQFMQACDGTKTIGEISQALGVGLDLGRSLQARQLIMLTPKI